MTRERPFKWGIESTRYHGQNVVRCKILTGLTRTPLVGAYLPTSTLEHLPNLEEDMQRFKYPIFARDLNMYRDEAGSLQSQRLLDLLSEYGLIDLVQYFQQRHRFQDLKTWSQVRQGTVL